MLQSILQLASVDDAIDGITIVLRCIVFGLSIWNMWWARRSAKAMLSGLYEPITIIVATIFWAAATAFTFQVAYFFSLQSGGNGIGDLWRLTATIVLVISMVMASLSHRIVPLGQNQKLKLVYDNLDVALAISSLAHVDPEAAKALAEDCRHRTAEILVSRNA